MTSTPRKAELIDKYVGERIKIRRRFLGLTQKDISAKLNISYQQFQKYENGLNRLSAGKLYRIASLLDVSIAWFFEGLPDPMEEDGKKKISVEDRYPRFKDIGNKDIQDSLRELIDAIVDRQDKLS